MLKVLIVEDEDIIRKGLLYTINWLSMDCLVAGAACNGKEGLQMILELSPQLVITDIRMPEMDGLEMIEQAQKTRSFRSVLLTSYSDFDYAKRAIGLHVFDYLLKPVDEEKLAQLVGKIRAEVEESETYAEILGITRNKAIQDLISWSLDKNPQALGNGYVVRTIKRIKQYYGEKLSVESIAEELGIRARYLSRKFKESTGQTFLDVLNKYRIQKAIALLGEGSLRVYEISDQVGFSEYKYFCSVFKKYTGMSPTEFAKSTKQVVCQIGGDGKEATEP